MTLQDQAWAWESQTKPPCKFLLVALSEILGDASDWRPWTARSGLRCMQLTGMEGWQVAQCLEALADENLIQWKFTSSFIQKEATWCIRFGYEREGESVDTYRPLKADPGYVYVLKADTHYKIGKSKHANKRIEQIQTASPYRVSRLARIETLDMGTLERFLHRRFAEFRENGEWFKLDESGLSLLMEQLREVSVIEAGDTKLTVRELPS